MDLALNENGLVQNRVWSLSCDVAKYQWTRQAAPVAKVSPNSSYR
jgi:hypothetical protein